MREFPHNNRQVVGSPYNVGTGRNGYPVGDGYTMARLSVPRVYWRYGDGAPLKIEGPHGIYTKPMAPPKGKSIE